MVTTTDKRPRAREGEEIWATTTAGTIYYVTTDSRGHEKQRKVGGKEGSRMRITTVDRELNQDAIDKTESDPWSNGLLKRLDQDQNDHEATQSTQAFETEELMAFFAKTGNAFQSQVRRLDERNVRRMRGMAEDVDASASQIQFLTDHIEEHYKIQGSMPSYDEMVTDGFIHEK